MPPVAKKKSKKSVVKRVSENKLRELADTRLAEFVDAAEVRYKGAKAVYDEQDAETKDSIDRMVDVLIGIARKRMWVAPSRGSEHRLIVEIPENTLMHNALYMAIEILKDFALMDVRVASFEFPNDLCGVCNRPRKKKGKK